MTSLPKIRLVHQRVNSKVARVPTGGKGRATRLNVSQVGQQPNKSGSGGGSRGKG